MKNGTQIIDLHSIISLKSDPAGARTQGPNIKSVVLYQLSYGIIEDQPLNTPVFGSAKIGLSVYYTKLFTENVQDSLKSVEFPHF